jgi:TnpA family transposase
LLEFVSQQLNIHPFHWLKYSAHPETKRDHAHEVLAYLTLTSFSLKHFRPSLYYLSDLALQTDKGVVLAQALVDFLRQKQVVIPSLEVIERLCAQAVTHGNKRLYRLLVSGLKNEQQEHLDLLLKIRANTKITELVWLRQPPGVPSAKNLLTHIERLKKIDAIGISDGFAETINQNRLLKLAREGAAMTAQNLALLEPTRQYATLAAVILETRATVLDELVDLHERMLGKWFNRAKRKHAEQFQDSGKAINHQLRLFRKVGMALVSAKERGGDAFQAIESVVPWQVFVDSISDAEKLSQPASFDHLRHIEDGYSQIRRYAPSLLEALNLKAAPAAQNVLDGIQTLKTLNESQKRKVPEDAPTGFIKKRWKPLVISEDGIERRYYELCALTELKNALRAGDISVEGSRQFKDFEDYLLPKPQSSEHNGKEFLEARLLRLRAALEAVNELSKRGELRDVEITTSGLKVTPLSNAVPDEAESFVRKAYSLLPHVKITDLLLEVDSWTGFTRHFTHLKSNDEAGDKKLLLTAILADGINLGLVKMAEACPGTTHAKLSWLQAWHIRDETYSAALAELVNQQARQPFSVWWGEGNTSSSDGQRFQTGGHSQTSGQVNLKYGQKPGKIIYTHISDQYAPYHSQLVNATIRDATYVLDGLLYHESDLRIEEHYTDTAGFTDHVFALMPLLGFRFAPRIRDLHDKRLYTVGKKAYPALQSLISGAVNQKLIEAHWPDIMRLADSIRQGTVTASLILRKLGSYPRQNGLAVALRELGRVERTLFMLEWIKDPKLRRRVQVGLNKGEARHALARAVFFNRLGEFRDRSFENQRYRASGLNLLTAAITLWNTVYLERAVQAMRESGYLVEEAYLKHLSPLGWEHINLTGDYSWETKTRIQPGTFRPLNNLKFT